MLDYYREDEGFNKVSLQQIYILSRCFGKATLNSSFYIYLFMVKASVCEDMETRSVYLRLTRILRTFPDHDEIQALGLLALSTILVNGMSS